MSQKKEVKKASTQEEQQTTERVQRLRSQTYTFAFRVFFIFSIPAILGAFVGNFIDEQFDIKPYGSLGILVLFYIVSWTGAYIIYRQIKKADQNSDIDTSKDIEYES